LKATDKFDDALDDLVRVSHQLGELLGRITAGRDGAPGAQRYDTPRTSGHTSVKYCETHQQDFCPCGEATVYPSVSDPTGETAVRLAARADQARRDLDVFHDAIRQVRHGRDKLLRLHGAWLPHPANDIERKMAGDTDPGPGCRSCARLTVSMRDGARITRWEPVHLDVLCRWCYDWRRKVGGVPPVEKLQDHHDGKRVTVPVEKLGAA